MSDEHQSAVRHVRNRTDYRDRSAGVTYTFVWLDCDHAYYTENRRKPPKLDAIPCPKCAAEEASQ